MKFLSDLVSNLRPVTPLIAALKHTGLIVAEGLCDGAVAPLLHRLAQEAPLMILCENEREAETTVARLKTYEDEILFYPARDLSLSVGQIESETFGSLRLDVLSALHAGRARIVVTTPEAALQTTLPTEVFSLISRTFSVGETLDPDELCRTLVKLGYTSADRVEGEGQFSRRGGIVDYFSPDEDKPCRVEFFGDEIERITSFDLASQVSEAKRSACRLLPAREMYLTPDAKETCLNALSEALANGKLSAQARAFCEAQKAALQSALSAAEDTLFPLCYKRETLLEHMQDAIVFCRRPAACSKALAQCAAAERAVLEGAASSGAFALAAPPPLPEELSLKALSETHAVLVAETLASATAEAKDLFSFDTRTSASFFENADVLFSVLSDLKDAHMRTCLLAQSAFAAQNLADTLVQHGFRAYVGDPNTRLPDEGEVCVFFAASLLKTKGRVVGLECPSARFCLLCEAEPDAPMRHVRRRTSSQKADALSSYTELAVGDYVVHEAHGIGVFEGLETITRDGAGRDFLKIRYAAGDALYVPASNLSALSKYVGRAEGGVVPLSRLGKATWSEHKRRAKSAARDIAKQLVALYAERENTQGHAFSPDGVWQTEFEEKFEYEETAGQLSAASDVKRDMESSRPMDRLLCGDVGFGKTEVALRAVFKCVMDSRQAAILAPTTILALQHYRTILSRFRGYPVRVEILSRFSKKKEIEKALSALKDGSCDIVVGTHRLLQKDVAFRRLGLLVVDEEQRFGVAHKELLKQLSKNVDVLTLTATPIPRTLNMALSGVRDLSLLEEPPADRQPVQTVVCPFDEAMILGAVKKELSRGGQVFYLVNNIERLPARAAWLEEETGARVRYAHGRMSADDLSRLWREMSDGDIDVLVCTTIIETGIDLPLANTLIIEHAERFGLSQLHQLRGRVGRSYRRAYAYFTYPSGRALPEIAEQRLLAIREFTRFGSGFQLAMRDLELRGAGSLLGADQSGHLEKVGYELYLRILAGAVLEERGEEAEETPDCYIDLPIRARLSEHYVPSSADRIALYRRFSDLSDENADKRLEEELKDRFGPLPEEAKNLFLVARLRRIAISFGMTKVSLVENVLSFFAPAFDETVVSLLSAVYGRYFYASGGETKKLNLRLTTQKPMEALDDFFFHYRAFTEDTKKR